MNRASCPDRVTKPCPGGCDHTDQEHEDFDAGVLAGEQGIEVCPFANHHRAEDWWTGHSVGTLNRKFPGVDIDAAHKER